MLLENVKNLVGRQFKNDFEKWIAFLSSLGYTTYWQILNAKHYGIPQNRERVFAVSVLGEHKPFKFPEKQELKLRLRDMIDDAVDEKFYLSERALTGILNTNFQQAKRRINNGDVCQTLLARDYKDPQCIQAGTLGGEKWEKMHEISRRVYEPDGIAPTIHCAGGGNTEPKIIDDAYRCREPRVYDDIAPALRSEWAGLKVVTSPPSTTDIKIVALRGRDKEGGGREQRLEPNSEGTANALTTVQKDNLLLEQDDSLVARGYRKFIDKNGYIPELFNAYNCAELKDTAPTMTTQCGSAASSASVLKAGATENPYILDADAEAARTIRVGGRGDTGRHCWNVIQIRENTKKGYSEAEAGDSINVQFPTSATRRGRVGKGISNTLTCGEGNAVVTDNIRIRKLTPRECLRLMGWTDAQIDRIVAAGISNAQQYRQAGNGIVVQVLEAIFRLLFFAV